MRRIFAVSLLSSLAACGNITPDQQAQITQELAVACAVDGMLVPLAGPVVASLGTGGAAAVNADNLVHPAVVAACNAIGGTPASAKPVVAPTSATTSTAH